MSGDPNGTPVYYPPKPGSGPSQPQRPCNTGSFVPEPDTEDDEDEEEEK